MPISTDKSGYAGISHSQAARILKREGFNELPSEKGQGAFRVFLNVVKEPMLGLLLVAGSIYFLMGELQDALMLMTFITFVIGITYYQERKTEKTLDALRNLSSPRALVVRGGEQKRIPGREIVRGDIVLIREGDRIPADAVVLECENLYVDESLLTGESVPVRKSKGESNLKIKRPGGDDMPFVFSGSMVVGGRGVAKVLSTGADTEIGKIGKSIESIDSNQTLLSKEVSRLVRWLGSFGIIVCVVFVWIYYLVRGNLLEGFLSGLALSMSMLPEEFPVVLIIFLTLGAWRISKKKVLTRRAAAIENLGATTVLCTDKTGTLTMNRMKLNMMYCDGEYFEAGKAKRKDISGKFRKLLEAGLLSSQIDPFDPIEKELKRACREYLTNEEEILGKLSLIKEYPLSKGVVALSHVWKTKKGDYLIASKGSPEAILELCHVNDKKRKEMMGVVRVMSDQGLRVLGCARTKFSGKSLPESQHDYTLEFLGFFWIR